MMNSYTSFTFTLTLGISWKDRVNKDLLMMGITWEEAEVAAQNRSEWRRSVAQCIYLDAGWIKVKVKVGLYWGRWALNT